MAHALRLRRSFTLSSSLLNQSLHRSAPSLPVQTSPLVSQNPTASLSPLLPQRHPRFFTSTTSLLSARNRSFDSNTDEIGPDTILFEGCDYNHWLIVIDFPKDPEPSREEMISFYEQTAEKVFGSLEEAKKKIYACSTTTYKGFQVECSEETSEKFHGLPGVVFVLPDSYIDPVNKEYGGDKYINGQIIPRPPPVQYGRQGPRRDFRSRPSPRGPMQGESRNYGPPQYPPPQQNFGQQPPPQQNFGQRPPPQQNFGQQLPPQQNFGQQPPPQQNFGQQPPPRQNFGQPPPPQQNYGIPPPQQNYGQPRPPQQHYGQQQNFPLQQNYGPPGAGEGRGPTPASNVPGGLNNFQGGRGDPTPSCQPNYNQGDRGNLHSQGQGDLPHADQRSYPPPQAGSSVQPPVGAHQERGTSYGQWNYPADQINTTQGVGQTNYGDQGRY